MSGEDFADPWAQPELADLEQRLASTLKETEARESGDPLYVTGDGSPISPDRNSTTPQENADELRSMIADKKAELGL